MKIGTYESVGNKILIVSERWWPDGTGGVLASHLIARMLRDLKFRVTVVHGTTTPVRLSGVRYLYSDLLSVRNKQRLWLNCLALAKQNWFLKLVDSSDIVYIPRYCYPIIPTVKKLGKRVVVHLHDYQPVSYNAIVLKDGVKIIPESFKDVVRLERLEHGSVLRVLGALSAPINNLCRLWLRDVDIIICVSKRQSDIVKRLAPELAEKVKVVYNPLPNVPSIEKNLKDPAFFYVGGDSYFKGFYVFLRASQKILKRFTIKFIIAGTFKRRDIAMLDRLNRLNKNVYHILGYVNRKRILDLHAETYALLFPSICEEPLPYAVMESMLLGTLPIASRVGGVPEILEETSAESFMFAPNDVEELIDRMECVLSMSRMQLIDIGISLRETLYKKFNQEYIRGELVRALSV